MIKQTLLELNIVIDNEFLDKYVELIKANAKTPVLKHRSQRHHIIPSYYYRSIKEKINNQTNNLVNLLYKDHIIAHYYLAKCSSNTVFKYYNILAVQNVLGHKCCDIKIEDLNLEEYQTMYENAMIEQGKQASKHHKNKPHSQEHTRKISAALKGRVCITNGSTNKYIFPEQLAEYEMLGWYRGTHWIAPQEWRDDISRRKKGTVTTEETREKIKQARRKQGDRREPALGHKMSETSKNQMREKLSQQICITNGKHELHIYPQQLQEYIDKGYRRGRLPRAWVMKEDKCTSIYERDLEEYLKCGWIRGRGKLKNKNNNINE